MPTASETLDHSLTRALGGRDCHPIDRWENRGPGEMARAGSRLPGEFGAAPAFKFMRKCQEVRGSVLHSAGSPAPGIVARSQQSPKSPLSADMSPSQNLLLPPIFPPTQRQLRPSRLLNRSGMEPGALWRESIPCRRRTRCGGPEAVSGTCEDEASVAGTAPVRTSVGSRKG